MTQSTPMTLNKNQKAAIIRGLMTKSIGKHGEAIVKASVALHELWRQQYIINAEKAYPYLSRTSWAELIQGGSANSQQSGVSVRVLDKKAKPTDRDSYSVQKVGQFYITCNTPEDKEAYEVIQSVVANAWTGLKYETQGVDVKSKWAQSYGMSMSLQFPGVLYYRVGDIRYSDFKNGTIEEPAQLEWATRAVPLVEQSHHLSQKIKGILEELAKYYQLLCEVMASIRTYGQLEEQFPEATEFCPGKPKRINQVVAVEQLAAARAIIQQGIPTE
ncbi:hypothetical protein [Pseudomonas sp.]|uniref:hypothetical protein n=1 Tax=Pseudomonas sp. TaxID=306 RepID=UPI003FD6F654